MGQNPVVLRSGAIVITSVRLAAGGLLVLVCATAASAQFHPKLDDAMHLNQVEDVIENAPDDAKVKLRGNIIQQLSDDLYLFSDSGAILVLEIDDEFEWPGEISEETFVEISGQVERDEGRVELEVTQLRILDASR